MSDLVLDFNKVKIGNDPRVLLEASFSDGEQILNAVLCLLLNLCLVQKVFELFKDCSGSSRSDLCEHLPHFDHEITGNLHRILGGSREEDEKDLKSKVLADDPLIDQVGYHFGGGHAHDLVISLEGPFELDNHPLRYQQADLWHLCVYHRDQGSIDVGEVGGSHLGLDN